MLAHGLVPFPMIGAFEGSSIWLLVAFVTFEIAIQSAISWWLAPRRARTMILGDLVAAGLLVVDDAGNLQRAPVVVDLAPVREIVKEELASVSFQLPEMD